MSAEATAAGITTLRPRKRNFKSANLKWRHVTGTGSNLSSGCHWQCHAGASTSRRGAQLGLGNVHQPNT